VDFEADCGVILRQINQAMALMISDFDKTLPWHRVCNSEQNDTNFSKIGFVFLKLCIFKN